MVFADRPLCWLDRQPDRPRRRFGSYYQTLSSVWWADCSAAGSSRGSAGCPRARSAASYALSSAPWCCCGSYRSYAPPERRRYRHARLHLPTVYISTIDIAERCGQSVAIRAADCFFTYFLRPSLITYTTVIQLFTTPTGGADAAYENRISIRKIV